MSELSQPGEPVHYTLLSRDLGTRGDKGLGRDFGSSGRAVTALRGQDTELLTSQFPSPAKASSLPLHFPGTAKEKGKSSESQAELCEHSRATGDGLSGMNTPKILQDLYQG